MSKSLLKSSYVVAAMTVLSRIVGLARETIFAAYFGTSGEMGAFFVAFQIPNFLRRLFAEGSFSQAFVPVLSEYRQTRSYEENKLFIDRMAGTLSLALLIITLLAIIVTPLLVSLFAPGFLRHPTQFQLTSYLLKITFPYLLFISLTAFAGSILNSYDIFSVPALTPVLLNFSLIAGAIFIAPHLKHPVAGLAWGVFIGGVVQLIFQLPFLYRIKLLPMLKLCWHDEGVKKVLKLMLPAIFGVSVAQLSLLIDTAFASFLPQHSIAWLYYSNRLMNFPLGVFGVAIATVILPHLSRKNAAKETQDFSQTLDWAIRTVFIIAVPAALGLILLSGPLITTILQYKVFTASDVIMARRSLIAFSLGLPAFMLIKILATAFYSVKNIKTPVKIAVISLLANMVLNLALIFPLAHAGLALASTLSSSLNAGLLFYLLRKHNIYQFQAGWLKYTLQLGVANLVLALFLFFSSAHLERWLHWNWEHRVLHLGFLVAGAALLYLGTLFTSGVRLRQFLNAK